MKLGYFSKDVAEELGVTTSTLRRWSLALEKQGYTFARNEQKQRVYYEDDFEAFRELKKYISYGMEFENAVEIAVTMISQHENAAKTPSVYQENQEIMRLSREELQFIIKKAVEEEREVILKAIDEKLSNYAEQRDRQLVSRLKMAMEQKQLELQQEQEIPVKRSIWSRMFSRG